MDRFTPKHFVFLILGTAIVSLKTYPSTFITDGRRDSSIAIILASACFFAFFLYLISIWKNNGKPHITKIFHVAMGKPIGNLLIYLFIIMLLITLVECAAVEADSMHKHMLIETPTWYFMLFFIVPAIYTIRKDLVAIVTVTMIGIVLIMLAGINLSIQTAQQKTFSNLLPLFENGITWGFIKCFIEMLGLYGSVSISLPYLSKIIDKKNKMNKYVMIGLVIVIQMEIISVVGLLMTFTPERISNMPYPKLLQTQLVSYMQFLEFGELYVMLQIVGGWLLKYVITFYALLIILRELGVSRKIIKYLTFIISGLVYIAAFFSSRVYIYLIKLLSIYEYLSIAIFVIIPLIVFTVYRYRYKKARKAG